MSSDSPVFAKKTEPDEDALSLARLTGQAFLHSAIQSPINGITQLVNKVADREVLPSPQLISAPEPSKFGSKSWFAETIGSGFGMIAPFLLTEKFSGAMLNKAGALTEKMSMGGRIAESAEIANGELPTAGRLGSAMRFAAPASKMAVAGAVYGFVLTPSADPNRDFWEQRGVSGASSAITFGTMGLATKGLLVGAESTLKVSLADAGMQSSLEGVGIRVGANAIGGAVGGVTSAESNSLLSGKGFATNEDVMHSIASFMVTGAGLDAAHIALNKSGELLASRENKGQEGDYVTPKLTREEKKMLDTIQQAHFEYFKQQSDPITGLTKDRSTDTSPASIAAVGFSLTAHPVAVSRGWMSRKEATDYTIKVLRNLSSTPQGDEATGVSGDHGFFYHFLDPKTGLRQGKNELSTIDTALLMGGVLFSKNYFDGHNAKETEIRELADNLYKRVDWPWALNSEGRLSMGWTPEEGFIKSDWQAYNEAQILLLLAMGSPTHPLPASAWEKFMSTSKVMEMHGVKSLEFGPMFGHQYTQMWVDYRGIKDATNEKLGFDYFENSRRAAIAQHQYAVDNPMKWKDYSAYDWGLTACDGPGHVVKQVNGKPVEFESYSARGFPNSLDDGTIAPTAAAASLPFVPELVMPTLKHWYNERPEILGEYGFQDSFNPTFEPNKPSGWVDKETLGIDQGPILVMAENYRSGFVWNMMKHDSYLQEALNKAGFKPDKTVLR
jgi:hypothetical protein